MTATHLEALRRLLFFSVPEAAQHVAHASERAWRLWERGERSVPGDVAGTIRRMVDWRERAIQAAHAAIADAPQAAGEAIDLALVWYDTLEGWNSLAGRESALWRPHCSVMAELVATAPGAYLVEFDAADYARWLGRRADSEIMRSRWAAQRPIDP